MSLLFTMVGSMKKFFQVLLAVSFLLGSDKALSWGKLGHEATAVIAAENLSPAAKLKVKELVGSLDLRESSLWPDVIRSQGPWSHTKPYHFTSVKDGSTYFESLEGATMEEKALGDAIRAMVGAEDVLRNPKSSRDQKLYALKFLVHFIGDIHQPLHTGRPEDRGGNQVSLTWFGRKDNLHSVWDTGILKIGLEGAPAWTPELAEDPIFYVSQLTKPSSTLIQRWQSGSFLEWHDEAQENRIHSYESATMPNHEVVRKFKGLLDTKIQQAGIRLAHTLNGIFEGKPLTQAGKELRRGLTLQLGAGHASEIGLEPNESVEGTIKSFSEYECDH